MEIEAKFSIPDERTFQRLLETSSLAGFQVDEATTTEMTDHYLDTEKRAIQTAGYACRMRHVDGHYVATLKGLGGTAGAIHRRAEYEVEMADFLPPQDWPAGTVRDLALQICDGEPLVLLFDIEQTRHKRCLHQGNRPVAEVSLDQVRLSRRGTVAASFSELEAELLPAGTEHDLERLSGELQERWGLAPEARSKFDQALTLFADQGAPEAAGAQPQTASAKDASWPVPHVTLLDRPGIEPDDAMSEAGRKVLRFHYRRMLYHEPGTRLGEDAEALHDMRVATRRMRAAFRLFGDYFNPQVVAPLAKGLKRTGRTLGTVRDLDVFRARLQAYRASLPGTQQGGLEDLLAVLEVQHEAARQRLIAYLDGKKYRRLAEGMGQFVENEDVGSLPIAPPEGEPRPYRVRHVAPMAIYERLAAVRAYDEWVSVPHPPPARLHALRIACKRLRYTLEFFQEALGPDTKDAVKEVVAMQDHLGALQDAVVASGLLRDFLVWGTWGHADADQRHLDLETAVMAPGVAAYLATRQAELQDLLDSFPGAWQRIRGMEFSGLIARSVAVL